MRSDEPLPDFRSPAFLRSHVLHTMAFYERAGALDPAGGFFHHFRDDGSLYDRSTRHLVSSTRFVVTHAWAARHLADHPRAAAWRNAARHGLRFLHDVHRDAQHGGYAWLLRFEGAGGGRTEVLDATHHAYGLAFVILAHAEALRAGVMEARAGLDAAAALLDTRFWEPARGLYADEATAQWKLSPYRGQNANMHACEALLAAHAATGEARFLDRAERIATAVTQTLAEQSGGLIWEHYRSDWSIDPHYNRDDRSNIFRPWGYQVGHLAEWAKLLLTLERQRPAAWLLPRATELFNAAVRHGWDARHGGLVYGFGPDLAWCDAHKYFWVQAESIAAAALLALRTRDAGFWRWYDELWRYAWRHFVDHRHGAWYRILTRENAKISDEKSPAGKVDYHTTGACWEVVEALAAPGAATPTPQSSA